MDFVSKFLVSTAKSIVSTQIKSGAKGLINRFRAKSPEDIHKEVSQRLGYNTHLYTISKDQTLNFRPSAVFFNEWLHNSPFTKDKIIKDEENGNIYFDGKLLSNSSKVEILNQFTKATDIKTASIGSHLEGALKLFDPSDYVSSQFKEEFKGWEVKRDSVIDSFIPTIFDKILVTDPKYASFLFRKWMIGTARRALIPGSPLDGCLTLVSPAGTGKTAFFRNLLPPPFASRTGELTCNAKNAQKFVENIVGKTVCSFDELSIFEFPKTIETFKQLMTSQFIDVRLAWRRDPQRFKLRNGFGATTNKKEFIPNANLSRRMWTIELSAGRLDFDFLFDKRKELWEEAIYLAQTEETAFLTTAEQKEVETNNQQYLLPE